MKFVNPNFLWALFAIAIPIIIHLINLRRHKIVYFSNTAFLKKIQKQNKNINKLKTLLILAARILMIAMLVITFACPYIHSDNYKQKNKKSITAIYIDNSYSMQSDSKSGKNIEQAKNIAKKIIFQNPENMKYILITNSYQPEYQKILDRNTIIEYINEIKINPQLITISDIILKIQALVDKNETTNLFLISDMQKTIFENKKINIPYNINIQLIQIPFVENNNIYIDSCFFESPIHRYNQKELLKLKIVNNTNDAIIDFPINLYINDSLKAMTNSNLQAKEEKIVEMEFVNTNIGEQKAKISIADFPITYDNDIYFTYNVKKNSNILIINENSENYYLNTLFKTNPDEIKYTNINIKSLQQANFINYDIIILNDIISLTSGLIADLHNYVKTGASLVIIPNKKIDENNLNKLINNFTNLKFTNEIIDKNKVKNIDYQNDIFKNVFIKQENQLKLPEINNIHKINNYNTSTLATVIADEANNPLLVTGNIKAGKLSIFAFPFDENNRDFLTSSLFVTSFLNIIFNSDIKSNLFFNINNNQVHIIAQKQISNYEAFKIFSENNIDSYLNFNNEGKKISFDLPNEVSNSGFYKIINIENDTISTIALNYDRNESKMGFLTKQELEKYTNEYLSGTVSIINIKNTTDIDLQLKNISEGKEIWSYFLILAILFLVTEMLLIKFI